MREEILLITTQRKGKLYKLAELSEYPEKSTIKCSFNGNEVVYTDTTDFGNILFDYNLFDFDKIVVEYKIKDLPLSLKELNTAEGLKNYIKNLQDLNNIMLYRNIAYSKKNIKLSSFVVYGKLLLDNFGQTGLLKFNKENVTLDFYNINKTIVDIYTFKEIVKSYSYCLQDIPHYEDTCKHCNQKWDLNNIDNFIIEGSHYFHKECLEYYSYEKAKDFFTSISNLVFNKPIKMVAIKNEYGSSSWRGPWFILQTEEGDIKIGWRKRVIEINWLSNYKKFSYNAENEDVTKLFNENERYIHADNEIKAIEYLKNALRSII